MLAKPRNHVHPHSRPVLWPEPENCKPGWSPWGFLGGSPTSINLDYGFCNLRALEQAQDHGKRMRIDWDMIYLVCNPFKSTKTCPKSRPKKRKPQTKFWLPALKPDQRTPQGTCPKARDQKEKKKQTEFWLPALKPDQKRTKKPQHPGFPCGPPPWY